MNNRSSNRSSTAAEHAPTTTTGRINGECLILSASKRTFDTCINEIGNYFPDAIKSVVLTQSSRRNDIFRDDLLSFVGFQSVLWRDGSCPNPPDYSVHPASLPSLMSSYLVLGYINGVQIWRLSPPQSNHPSSHFYLPVAERVFGFRTQCSVRSVQLISDIPSGFPSSNNNRQSLTSSSRIALVQHRPNGGSNSVDIFSSTADVHVLQQPWPVIRLASSLTWGGWDEQRWVGTLVVATTQQIRIYDTSTFVLRFTIADFQSISLPPLWRWLAADSTESPFVMLPTLGNSRCRSEADDQQQQAATRSSGPIFTIGTRWICYQTSAALPQQPAAAEQQPQQQPVSPSASLSPRTGWRAAQKKRWIVDPSTTWKRVLASPAITRLSNARLLGDLLFDQANTTVGSFLPVVETHADWNDAVEDSSAADAAGVAGIGRQQQSGINSEPVGGSIVIVDLITGEVVGSVDVDGSFCNNNNESDRHVTTATTTKTTTTRPTTGVKRCRDINHHIPHNHHHSHHNHNRHNHNHYNHNHSHHDHHHPTFVDPPSISEVQDGSWWLSHVEASQISSGAADDDNNTPATDNNCRSCPKRPIPLMSHMAMDLSGTTLFCTEWTGCRTWVIRLTTIEHQKPSSFNSRIIVGVPVYELFRGHTAGSLVDVSSSSNVIGETVVIVASSRGSGHCFSLPSGFHQSLPQQQQQQSDSSSSASLLLPTSLHSNYFPYPRQSKRSTAFDHRAEKDSSDDSDDINLPDILGNSSSLSDLSSSNCCCSRSVSSLPIAPLRFNLTSGFFAQSPQLNRRHSICRINLLSANKLDETNFYWKVNFLPSPFFLPPVSPSSSSSSSSRRSLRFLRWPSDRWLLSHHNNSSSVQPNRPSTSDLHNSKSSHRLLLPFLIASSNGVIDFCHAEFAAPADSIAGRSSQSGSQFSASSNEPMVPSDLLLPSVMRNPTSGICLLAEADGDDELYDHRCCNLDIEHQPPRRDLTDQGSSPSWVPSKGNASRLSFVTTSIARSYSSRDMELWRGPIKQQQPPQPTSAPSIESLGIAKTKTKAAWAQHCEPITSVHHKFLYTVRFLCGESCQVNLRGQNGDNRICQNSRHQTGDRQHVGSTPKNKHHSDALNQLFRSGCGIRHLFIMTDDQLNQASTRLQVAIDAALYAPITSPAAAAARSIDSATTTRSIDNTPTSPSPLLLSSSCLTTSRSYQVPSPTKTKTNSSNSMSAAAVSGATHPSMPLRPAVAAQASNNSPSSHSRYQYRSFYHHDDVNNKEVVEDYVLYQF